MKIHGGKVAAICDENLLGKEFREGEVVLKVSREYYGGEIVGKERVKEVLQSLPIIGLVGEGCIGIAVELGLADWRFVKRVAGIPHLNIYRL